MPPALLYLNNLRWRAMGRRMFRGVRTVKGAIFFGFGILVLASWLGPSLMMSMHAAPADPNRVIALTSMFMITMCVLYVGTSAGDKAIYFSPGEVEFLFPGPFTRRQLLVYKLFGVVTSTALGALLFSVFIARFTGSWPKSYIGLFSALLFVQLFTMAALLIGQSVNERAYTKFRKRVVTVFLILLAIGLGQILSLRRGGAGMTAILNSIESSSVLKYVLMPLQPFGRVIAASTWAECGMWLAVAMGMNGALVLIIMVLDAEFRETAIAVSHKVTTQMERARRSGMAQSTRGKAGKSLPALPWLGGAGPLLWRQLTNAARNARGLMFMLVLMGTAATVPVLMMHDGNIMDNPIRLTSYVGGIVFWITIMLSMMIRYDFRTDLDQMDWLKSLPLRPTAVAAGQIIVPVMLASLLQTFVVIGLVASGMHWILLAMTAFFVPVNLILFGVENFVFLLFPSRVVAFSPGDFQLFGKQMVLILAKMAFILVATLPAGIVWAAVRWATDSNMAALVTGWFAFTLLAFAVIPAVAWSFKQFDVSLDTAG